MEKNPLLALESLGQSIWLDDLSRKALDTGELQRLIEQDGISGITSNPSIFEKALSSGDDYDEAIHALSPQHLNDEQIYQTLTVDDIRRAADLFRPQFDRLDGADGFVSLEVSPRLAHDTAGSVAEAHKLWDAVNRPNLFIKIPATREGLPAIRQLIGEGINVNITLLFGLGRYREVVEAYLAGLETLAAHGEPLAKVASVASFFLSRIDVLIDPMLEKLQTGNTASSVNVAALHGQVAIASAKVAYQIYKEIFGGQRFQSLAQLGARPQRLLWASTSTKNPAYSDVKYVEPLIGPSTINTMPLETINAYRDHGKPALQLDEGVQEAYAVLNGVNQAGLNLDTLTQQLENEGIEKFDKAYDKLLAGLHEKTPASSGESVKP
jgi:transaldolase